MDEQYDSASFVNHREKIIQFELSQPRNILENINDLFNADYAVFVYIRAQIDRLSAHIHTIQQF